MIGEQSRISDFLSTPDSRGNEAIAIKSVGFGDSDNYTFGQMVEAAEHTRAILVDCSIQPDEPVIVFVSNMPEDIIAMLGIWLAGGVAVPVHRNSGSSTLASVLSKTASRLIVIGSKLPEATLPDGDIKHGDPKVLTLRKSASKNKSLAGAAFIVFTSGSTGDPKGVVITHEAFVNKLQAIQATLNFPMHGKSLIVLQLNFAFAQWFSFLTLANQGTVVLAEKFEPNSCIEAFTTESIDSVALVPTMMRAIVAHLSDPENKKAREALKLADSPRLVCSGGEPLAVAVAEKFSELLSEADYADVFGLTETCTSDFILVPELFKKYAGSIGFPSPGVEYRIVQQGSTIPVAVGSTGELEIRTPFMMTSYLNDSETTKLAFSGDYFKTGDLAYVGEGGAVYLAGRSKDLIVRGGNKISPIEIDSTLIRHPEIEASLTVGLPDEIMGERIHTVVITRNESLDRGAVKNWMKKKVDPYKIPDTFYFDVDIPKGATGKDDRKALRHKLIEYQERERRGETNE